MDGIAQNLYGSNMDSIASYNLFGESTDLPDVVHCETIRARSVVHNWEFRPHRHGRLHQFLCIERGGGRVEIDGRVRDLTAGNVVNVPTGFVHAYRFVEGTEGWVVTVASEVLDQTLAEGEGLRPLLGRPALVQAEEDIPPLMRAIFAAFHGRDFARAHVLRAQVALLAGLVARRISHQGAQAAAETPLQRRFEALLEAHFTEHWSVADYAEALAVTPTHLSRVLREATGQPASAAIAERVIREARRNLVYSNLSVSEIAYALGYGDPAHFSRVFSRATGQSPRAFRAAIAD